MTVSQETLQEGLSKTLEGTNFEALGRKLLAPLSVSLGMPAGYFDPSFERSSSMTRAESGLSMTRELSPKIDMMMRVSAEPISITWRL